MLSARRKVQLTTTLTQRNVKSKQATSSLDLLFFNFNEKKKKEGKKKQPKLLYINTLLHAKPGKPMPILPRVCVETWLMQHSTNNSSSLCLQDISVQEWEHNPTLSIKIIIQNWQTLEILVLFLD